MSLPHRWIRYVRPFKQKLLSSTVFLRCFFFLNVWIWYFQVFTRVTLEGDLIDVISVFIVVEWVSWVPLPPPSCSVAWPQDPGSYVRVCCPVCWRRWTFMSKTTSISGETMIAQLGYNKHQTLSSNMLVIFELCPTRKWRCRAVHRRFFLLLSSARNPFLLDKTV